MYISPSRQEILDKLAAEAEARRLAELADDFRERALIEMMDGVLELLWEHKIKKDIPKPKCMVNLIILFLLHCQIYTHIILIYMF